MIHFVTVDSGEDVAFPRQGGDCSEHSIETRRKRERRLSTAHQRGSLAAFDIWSASTNRFFDSTKERAQSFVSGRGVMTECRVTRIGKGEVEQEPHSNHK